MSSSVEHGPPYVPKNATPGQHPNVVQDIAPSAIFLALYILSGVCHQVTFQRNRRRGHKFPMSWAMFGFAMARMGTMVMRIAWATRPDNGSVALAATIFAFLGVLVIYIVVLLLSLRVFRARQPRLGWNVWLGKGIKIMYGVLLIVTLVVVPFGIVAGFTRDPEMLNACAWITKAGVLFFFLFNLIAPVLYLLALFLPRPKDIEPETFGTGSMQAKLVILGVVLFFTNFISVFRFAVTWAPYRPLSHPAWYDSRAAFYIIELSFELVITFTLLFTRFDKRFWIPNGSSRPGDYSSIDFNGSEHKSLQLEQVQDKQGINAETS
ncbi:Nn.00g105440.m01.CDS01 [Neocucurbitaria sp. VM-36]